MTAAYAPATVSYPIGERIGLPPILPLTSRLDAALLARRSVRSGGEPPLAAIGTLLHYCFAPTGAREGGAYEAVSKYVPSGGAMHALEPFIALADESVSGFDPSTHALVPLETGCGALLLRAAAWAMGDVEPPPALIAIGRRLGRGDYKYGTKNGRLLAHSDLGCIYQTAALAAVPLGCGVCPLGPQALDSVAPVWPHFGLVGGLAVWGKV